MNQGVSAKGAPLSSDACSTQGVMWNEGGICKENEYKFRTDCGLWPTCTILSGRLVVAMHVSHIGLCVISLSKSFFMLIVIQIHTSQMPLSVWMYMYFLLMIPCQIDPSNGGCRCDEIHPPPKQCHAKDFWWTGKLTRRVHFTVHPDQPWSINLPGNLVVSRS